MKNDEIKDSKENITESTTRQKSLVERVFDIDGLVKKILPEKIYKKIAPFMESALFVFWGAVTTIIGLLFYHGLVFIGIVGYKYAKIIQMIFSKVLSYVCNKFGVFKTTENKKSEDAIELVLFIIIRAVIMVIDYYLLVFFVQVLGIDEIIANYVEFPIVIGINYVTSKLIIYNRKLQIFLRKLFSKSEE